MDSSSSSSSKPRSLAEAQQLLLLIQRNYKITEQDLAKLLEDVRNTKKPKKNNLATNNPVTTPIALQIYYDGSQFNGFAETKNNVADNSVEKQLFAALNKTCLVSNGHNSKLANYSRCGRTDAGVSAVSQIVALNLRSSNGRKRKLGEFQNSEISNSQRQNNGSELDSSLNYCKMLNGVLPASIRVVGCSTVTQNFSARFSATDRTYRYFFIQRNLNLTAMREALSRIVGSHDFRNFCKMDVEQVSNFKRFIHSADIHPLDSTNNVYYIQIKGQAFLWHMVRCIVAVCFMVGRGLEEPTVMSQLLNVHINPRKPQYTMASEYPLVLHGCGFQNLSLKYSVSNLWDVQCHMEKQWEELMLAAARARNMIESLSSHQIKLDELHVFIKERNDHVNIDDDKSVITWGEALNMMKQCNIHPSPDKKTLKHIPLMKRHKGPTYEEKVANMTGKRKEKYEENRMKQGTAEEDAEFYARMAKEGCI